MALALRVSWICLLLFRIGSCFPLESQNSPFPFPLIGPESSPNLRSAMSLQPEAAGQQTGSQTGNQSPRSLGAPRSAAGFSPDYEPGLAMTYGSSSDSSGAPAGRSFSPWYLNRLAKKTPDVPDQQQSGSDSGGGPAGGGSSPGYDGLFPPGVVYSGNSGAGSASSSGGAAPGLGGGADPFGFPFAPGLPWEEPPAGGLHPSVFLKHLAPHRLFPVKPWETDEVPLGMIELPPVVPSSYLVQSNNGYQRAREHLSHSKYSPDTFDNFPLPPSVAQTTIKTPVTGSPGGKAYPH